MKYRSLVKCIAGKREFRLWNEKPGDLGDQRKLSQQNSQKCAKMSGLGSTGHISKEVTPQKCRITSILVEKMEIFVFKRAER